MSRQTVLLTGATDGIGLALARRYAERGARLVLVGRRRPATLGGDPFGRALYLRVDLARDDAAGRLLSALEPHAIGAIDRLIHNAAVGEWSAPAAQRAERLDELLAVDLYAPLTLTHALLPRLAPGGRVAFVGSVAADLPAPDYPVYAAAKAALAGFARALRAEGLDAVVVHPGATRSGIHRKSGAPDALLRAARRWPEAGETAARLERAVERGSAVATLGLGNRALRFAGRHLPALADAVAAPREAPPDPPQPLPAPRTAVVTGAASGIGLELAAELAARGWRVVGIDRDAARSERAERVIAGRAPGAPPRRWIVAELSSDAGLERAEAELAERPCDLLVHCAGINAVGRFASVEPATHRAVLDVNLRAPLQLTRAALAAGGVARGGAVVLVSSLSHYVGYPGAASYAASKDGIASYGRSLAVALAPAEIRVLTVFPGPTRTPHAREHSPPGSDETRRMAPERVATGTLRALARGRRRYVPGARNRLFAALGRVAPGVTEAVLRRALLERIEAAEGRGEGR